MKQTLTEKYSLKAQGLIQKYLAFNEEIVYLVKQKYNLLSICPECIGVTTERFFFCIPTGFGSELSVFNCPLDYIENITIKHYFLGSVIKIHLPERGIITTKYLSASSANELYDFIIEKSNI